MIISLPKEIMPQEKRVALIPETIKKLTSLGFKVKVQKDAGSSAGYTNQQYEEAGAEICEDAAQTYKGADIICKINAPLPQEDSFLKKDMTVIAHFNALKNQDRTKEFAKKGLTCFALDLLPRISRAQSMDILSSQSSLAGYQAVIKAAEKIDRAMPLMMTAAGTVPPAKVLILGAGVAGLQAIATAKRLGAQVFASDVRPQVKEQVESLGGKFLEVPIEENLETEGGYAKETSEEYQRKQKELITQQLKQTDIAITTALIPGKKAPILITKEMIENMPLGSVIIDMAASEEGGNVEGSKPEKEVSYKGIKIIGAANLASEIATSASKLFSNNIYNFLLPMFQKEEQTLRFDFKDELIAKTCICKNGESK